MKGEFERFPSLARPICLAAMRFLARRTDLSRQHPIGLSNIEERAHRNQAMRVLGEAPVAGLAVTPQPFDRQKRMLDGGTNRALSAVALSLRLGQRGQGRLPPLPLRQPLPQLRQREDPRRRPRR